ncbi:MAG: ribonuclease H-like domain-containing protein [Deltaproteobacteria bacterium]|nr:ribonuclease H-like domain-containing protein [Deltaproteobacteria bacterium]
MKLANEIFLDIETTGLLPWHGNQVTCICAKTENGTNIKLSNINETTLIKLFLHWLHENTKGKTYTLVTFNGKIFDIPFIMARCVIGADSSKETALFLLDYPHIDIFEEIQKLIGKRLSLNTVAKLLGCTPKSGDGLNAIKLWEKGKYDELQKYCFQDVLTTEEVYLKWMNLHK